MKINEIYVIRFLRETYGGTIFGVKEGLCVTVNSKQCYVSFSERKRTGHYQVFHEGEMVYHNKNLAYILFVLWSFMLYEDLGVIPTWEDWARLVNDAYKYKGRCE